MQHEVLSALLIIIACILSIISAIYSLSVPWVRTNVVVDEGNYRINIPIEIGLLKCFSEVCHDFQNLGLTSINGELASSDAAASDNNNQSSIHIPKPKVPVIPKIPVIIDIKKLIRQSILKMEEPYKRASIVTIAMLTFMGILCLSCILVSIYFAIRHRKGIYRHQLSALVVSLLLQALSVLSYIAMTISYINGGEYLIGVWLVIYTTITSIALAMMSSIIYDRSYSQSYGYHQIPRDIEMPTVQAATAFTGANQSIYGSLETAPKTPQSSLDASTQQHR
jgi:hypothetical protein